MDYLDKLTHLAQVRGEINIRCEFQGEWQVEHNEPMDSKGIFHLIEEGECWLTLGEKQFHLKQGDIFFSAEKSTALDEAFGERKDDERS